MPTTPAGRRPDLQRVRAALPAACGRIVDEFERHLSAERGLSAHTVRAYVGDVVSLVAHLHAVAPRNPQHASVKSGGVSASSGGVSANSGGVPASSGGAPADADLSGLDVRELRGWLAVQHAAGVARTTLARRSASARTFTAWATRSGHLAVDPGQRLASPRPHRTLPGV
ncbi:MAG: site-specific integrase, partial [Thermocrispum sp.]